MIRALFITAAAAAATGCTSTDHLIKVLTPVPIPCQAPEPARPAMDTETIDPAAPIDHQARAMRAEIERREGYEGELRAALRSCIAFTPART